MITGGKQVHTSSLKPESLFYGKMHTRNGGKKRKKKKGLILSTSTKKIKYIPMIAFLLAINQNCI